LGFSERCVSSLTPKDAVQFFVRMLSQFPTDGFSLVAHAKGNIFREGFEDIKIIIVDIPFEERQDTNITSDAQIISLISHGEIRSCDSPAVPFHFKDDERDVTVVH